MRPPDFAAESAKSIESAKLLLVFQPSLTNSSKSVICTRSNSPAILSTLLHCGVGHIFSRATARFLSVEPSHLPTPHACRTPPNGKRVSNQVGFQVLKSVEEATKFLLRTSSPLIMDTTLRTVLIIGGTGFVGHHLVSQFVSAPEFDRVFVLSRSCTTSKFRVSGATYLPGDLTDHGAIQSVLEDIKPTVVVDAASPSTVTGTTKEYMRVNVLGTKNLLKCAKHSPHVRAFIFTSSSTIAKGRTHVNLDEKCEIANTDPRATPYAKSKADAETMVLRANYPKPADDDGSWTGHLATAALRLPIVYGTGNMTLIPGCLNALAQGQTNLIFGDGTNTWSYCSARNAGAAHVLLACALLNDATRPAEKRCDGEAFNINDGTEYPFWEFPKLCWKFAGYDPTPPPKTTHLPVWVALLLANFLEWVFWIFTIGMKRPYQLGKQQVEIMCFTHTYSIEKARQRLGYVPHGDFQEEVKKAVDWSLSEGGWRGKLKSVKGLRID